MSAKSSELLESAVEPFPEPLPDHVADVLAGEALVSEALAKELIRSEHLARAVVSNRRIGVAVGLVMAQLALNDTDAFEILRQHSMNTNRRLADLAEDVISLRKLTLHPAARTPTGSAQG